MKINAKNDKGLYLIQFDNYFLFLKWMRMQIGKPLTHNTFIYK